MVNFENENFGVSGTPGTGKLPHESNMAGCEETTALQKTPTACASTLSQLVQLRPSLPPGAAPTALQKTPTAGASTQFLPIHRDSRDSCDDEHLNLVQPAPHTAKHIPPGYAAELAQEQDMTEKSDRTRHWQGMDDVSQQAVIARFAKKKTNTKNAVVKGMPAGYMAELVARGITAQQALTEHWQSLDTGGQRAVVDRFSQDPKPKRLMGTKKIPRSYMTEMAAKGITSNKAVEKHWRELGKSGQKAICIQFAYEQVLTFDYAPLAWKAQNGVVVGGGIACNTTAVAAWKALGRTQQDAVRAAHPHGGPGRQVRTGKTVATPTLFIDSLGQDSSGIGTAGIDEWVDLEDAMRMAWTLKQRQADSADRGLAGSATRGALSTSWVDDGVAPDMTHRLAYKCIKSTEIKEQFSEKEWKQLLPCEQQELLELEGEYGSVVPMGSLQEAVKRMNSLLRDPFIRSSNKRLATARKRLGGNTMLRMASLMRDVSKAGVKFAVQRLVHKRAVVKWRAARRVRKHKGAKASLVQQSGVLGGGVAGDSIVGAGQQMSGGTRHPLGVPQETGTIAFVFHPAINVLPSDVNHLPGRSDSKYAPAPVHLTMLTSDVTMDQMKAAQALLASAINQRAAPVGTRILGQAEVNVFVHAFSICKSCH